MKALVKKVVQHNDIECWKASKHLYPELDIFYKSFDATK